MFGLSNTSRARSATLGIGALAVACGSSEQPDPDGVEACEYPKAPYGIALGEALAPNYAWEGFAAYAGDPSVVRITDFFDCDGTRQIHACLFVTIAHSCDECRPYLMDLDERMGGWEGQGVRIVVLVGNGADGAATVSDAALWKSEFDLEALFIVADPNFSFMSPSDGIPVEVVVDPRAMRVVARDVGIRDEHPALEALIRDNGDG